MHGPLVIEAALNGATTKAQNPHVPRSAAEIVSSALRCVTAGASIVHNHNDEPNFGAPTGRHSAAPYRTAWARILEKEPDLLLYPTVAGRDERTSVEERYGHVAELHEAGLLRMSMADPGSLSVAVLDPAGRPIPSDLLYLNTTAEFAWMLRFCRERLVPVSVSVFEPGFLRVALAHFDAGDLPPGSKLVLYFGGPRALFGLPPTEAALDLYLSMLGSRALPWMVAVMGGDVVASGLAREAVARGGHVRVGLEDYEGSDQPTNEALVATVAEVAFTQRREVASPAAAREVLGVPRRSA